MKKELIIIGTRSSELALWQADFVKNAILKKNKNVEVVLKKIKTKGDKILNVSLSKIGDKGLFTKELENLLLNFEIDLAVHSLKDLETELPKGLILAAVTKRHDVEDVLIARKKNSKLIDIPHSGTVATGSLRRKSQLLNLRPDLKIVDLRGNVPTRIKKFLESDWDGIILARAGVERLKMKKYISSIIPSSTFLPAVGQGALGIEINKKNKFVAKILKSIHDEKTFSAVKAERAFLKKLEGGCQAPIGAFAEVKSNGLYLSGFVGSLDGTVSIKDKMRGRISEPEKLGRELAKKILRSGAKKILNDIYGRN